MRNPSEKAKNVLNYQTNVIKPMKTKLTVKNILQRKKTEGKKENKKSKKC